MTARNYQVFWEAEKNLNARFLSVGWCYCYCCPCNRNNILFKYSIVLRIENLIINIPVVHSLSPSPSSGSAEDNLTPTQIEILHKCTS